MSKTYQNWKIERTPKNIVWLYFDKYQASTNSISPEVLNELESILNDLDSGPTPAGLIIASAKKTGFIAGADISHFRNLTDTQEARHFIEHGQKLFKKIADLKYPSVALIEGFALGGGLELALACRYRIAEDSEKTLLGLPEVMLGIQPGWGGTFRLGQHLGAKDLFDMILKGRTVNAKKAYKLGIVDAVVPNRHLVRAAEQFVLNPPAPHKASTLQSLTHAKFIRPLIGYFVKQQLQKSVREDHYPAPYAIVKNWIDCGIELPAAMNREIDSIVQLTTTPTAKNLIRVFYLKEQLKSLAKGADFKAKHVHVIGAGTMGGDIAAWCALKGLNVTLQDREPKFIAPAMGRTYKLFKAKLKEDRLVELAMDRILADVEGYGIARADVIIEAISENPEAKQNLFKMLEQKAKPDAILASNTSSIPLDEISSLMKKPERLVGIHYFNPVAKMELVEVVKGKKTNAEVVSKAMVFVKQISRLPLPVTSTPGFLVNRVLTPYLLEAVALLEEGIPPEVIDQAAEEFGMPMGPIELADTVGLDICLSVGENLTRHFGGEIPARLKQMVSEGKLGRKSGKGFYEYKNGKAQKAGPKDYPKISDTIDRLILRMLNEATACLREEVVADADLLDAGMIFGTGFAPFRGGPMQYVRTEGREKLRGRLNQLADLYGSRFQPDEGWEQQENLASEAKGKTEKISA